MPGVGAGHTDEHSTRYRARESQRLYRFGECTTVVPMLKGDLPKRDPTKELKGFGAVPRNEVVDKMTFRVVFTKEGKDWTVIAPDVHPAHSWGPSLKSAAEHIKEACLGATAR